MIVTANGNVIRQLRLTGTTTIIGADNVYRSTTFLGESTRRAHDEAVVWVTEQAMAGDPPTVGRPATTTTTIADRQLRRRKRLPILVNAAENHCEILTERSRTADPANAFAQHI